MTSTSRPRLTPLLSALAALGVAVGCGGSGAPRDGGQDSGDAGDAVLDSGADATGAADVEDADAAAADAGGDTSVACAVGGTGMLVLAIKGLPATMPALTPMVRVSGGGLETPVTLSVGAPASLPARGGYELESRRVRVAPEGGAIVGKAFYASASSFDGCVVSGATTTATLTYTEEPGSEHLWIAVSSAPDADDEIGGFASADLGATGAANPIVWKADHFTSVPGAGAVDAFGNLWVPGGDVVNMYPMLKLATSGDQGAPTVVLGQPAASPAAFAAFDSSGNLWVTRGAPASSVVRYTPTDQVASGTPVPAVVITSPDLKNPAGLAFDPLGDLWVASEGNDEVLKFTAGHLGASYAGAADVVLMAETAPTAPAPASYTAPHGLAFDQAGNLWVGFVSQLVALTPAQQLTSGVVVGPRALDVAAGTGGFAFDESGGLWVRGDTPSTFRRFPKATLDAGDASPDIVITSSALGYAESLVLDPSPTWSPLHDGL
jgi:hypothetical protein